MRLCWFSFFWSIPQVVEDGSERTVHDEDELRDAVGAGLLTTFSKTS